MEDFKTAKIALSRSQKVLYFSLFFCVLLSFLLNIKHISILLFLFIHIFYFLMVVFKIIISTKASFLDESYAEPSRHPTYTILLPLYKEIAVFKKLINSISNLNYPKDRLDVQILLEQDDIETFNVAKSMNLPEYFRIIQVPEGTPKTKPRACNYGLTKALGEFLVIYDAEDIPHVDQLKNAVYEFDRLGPNHVCLQARLNWFNAKENWLTKMFCVEYTTWFNYFIHGLCAFDMPFPLGGTSNHFRVSALRHMGGWDAYNVTEDADIGIRLQAEGYKSAFLNSVTLEESVTDVWSWTKQRTRWIKGYIQTFFVHTRDCRYINKTGIKGFMSFIFFIFGTFFVNLLNPILYTITILWYVFGVGTDLYPYYTWVIGIFCLVVGNISLILLSYVACRSYKLSTYALFLPIYWLMMSVASYRALWYFIFNPHKWEKTEHGKTSFNSDVVK